MKNKGLKLFVFAVGFALVASCLLPPFPAAKRHATKIHAVNSVSSFSYSISTNTLANLQIQKP